MMVEVLGLVAGSSTIGAIITGLYSAYAKNKDSETATQKMLMDYAAGADQDRKEAQESYRRLIELGFAKERSEHYSRRYMEKAQPAVHIWGPAPELPAELDLVFGDIVKEENQ